MPGLVEPGLQNLGWTPFWVWKMMGITSLNLDTESPHRRRQTDEYRPRQPGTLNGSNTCVGSKVDASNVDTGVVPATTSPTPKLEWGKRY